MIAQKTNLSLLPMGAAHAVPAFSDASAAMPASLRWLCVKFNGPMDLDEIPAFRGAVNAAVGRVSDLFHNHTAEGKCIHRYPRIQYKRVGHNPLIVCVNEGADMIHALLANRPNTLNLNGRQLDFGIQRLEMKGFPLRVWNRTFDYRLRRWIPLTDDSYGQYVHELGMVERMALLERKLTNQIVALWRDLSGQPTAEITAQMTELYSIRPDTWKGMPVAAFDIRFRTNVFLPDFIGLGKGVSHGYGTVKSVEGHRL